MKLRMMRMLVVASVILISACNREAESKAFSCPPVIDMEVGEFASWLLDDGQQIRSISLEQVSDGHIDVIADGELTQLVLASGAECTYYSAEVPIDPSVEYLIYGAVPADAVAKRVLGLNGAAPGEHSGYDARPPIDQALDCELGAEDAVRICSGHFTYEAATFEWIQTFADSDPAPGLGMTGLTISYQEREVLKVWLDEWNGL